MTKKKPERTPDELRMAVLDKYWASVANEGYRLQRIGNQLQDVVEALESRYSHQARFDRFLRWGLFIFTCGMMISALGLRYL